MLKKIFYNKKIVPWLFLAPFLLFFVIFKVGPILYSIFLSFHQLEGLLGGEFVGLKNYFRLMNDQEFFKALWNNTKYMIGTMITLIPIPLILAIMLDSKYCKGRKFYKTILFIPSITSLVIAAAVFKVLLYEGESGLVNVLVSFLGMSPKGWLTNPLFTIPSVVLIATWRWTGINMIYFTTGLTGISRDMYEAASIDGANMLQRFFYITLPLLKPIIIFVVTLNIIGGYKLFAEVYTLWPGGGSPNQSALTLAILLYRNAFSYFRMGYASAIGLTMAFIILIISTIQLKLTGFFNEE